MREEPARRKEEEFLPRTNTNGRPRPRTETRGTQRTLEEEFNHGGTRRIRGGTEEYKRKKKNEKRKKQERKLSVL